MRKYTIIFFSLIAVVFLPKVAFGANFCASGFGSASVNGTWTEGGVQNDKPYYNLSTLYAYYPSNGNGWYLGGTAMDNSGPLYYTNNSGYTNILDVPSWMISGGSSPAGSIVSGSCTYTPTVTTQAVSSIGQTTATGNGNITDDGGGVTSRGVRYGQTTSYGATTTQSGTYGTGAFTASITSLTCNTLYHVQAYAINGSGTAYGSDVDFTTSSCDETPPPPVVSGSINTFMFLITGMGLYLLQLVAILIIFYIATVLICWPIKGLWDKMKMLIRRGGEHI